MRIKERIYTILSKVGVKIFQNIFPDYFAKEPLKPTDRYLEYPFAIRNLPKPKARILDVGCSGSYFPLLLAAFGYETYCLDIRKYEILNTLKISNLVFKQEDIRKTTFADNFFDAVIAISSLEHIGLAGRYGSNEDKHGDGIAVNEMKRVLKENGTMILTLPFGKAKVIRPYSKIYDEEWISDLIGDLKIEQEEYYFLDSNDDWVAILKSDAAKIDCTADRYALCLLKLTKNII